MNRTTLFGIALFFAILGIAVMGSDNQASAGIGCGGARHGGLLRHHRGCAGAAAVQCCGEAPVVACAGDTGCGGARRCGGGLLARLRARHACRGAQNDCCGQAAPACEPTCAAPVACEPTCGAPAPACGGCGGCGACGGMMVEPSCGAPVIMESAPVEAPAEGEVAPEVPPAPAEEAAEGSA